MKKILLLLMTFSAFAFSEEICNVNGSYKAIPEGSCVQYGYVCNVGFTVSNEQKALSFYLAVDQACQTLLQTKFETIRFDNSTTKVLRLSLIESEEYHTDALALTLAGSLALSASNSKVPVSVIYHQVGSSEYGGILLQAISQVGN